jgi:hypothetical protein
MLLRSSKMKNVDKSQFKCENEVLYFENSSRFIIYEDIFYCNEALNVVMKYSPGSVYVDLICFVSDLSFKKIFPAENVFLKFFNDFV